MSINHTTPTRNEKQDTAYDFLLCLIIGIALAAALVHWWST